MIINQDNIVYHGSYIEVQNPDISKCRYGKDFGRGFYVTTDRKQAERFVKTAVRKAISDGRIDRNVVAGVLNTYKIGAEIQDIKYYEFPNADSKWLHCVVAHRKKNSLSGEYEKWKDFDAIAGKIANDNTNLVITAYMDGAYGEIGSDRADNIAISFLEPDNLKDQICFRTDAGLKILQFIGSEQVRL